MCYRLSWNSWSQLPFLSNPCMKLSLCLSPNWGLYTWATWTVSWAPLHVCFTINGNAACYGKPITSLCRELRDSMNMYKINAGWIQLWTSTVVIVYSWHNKMWVFLFLRRWLKVAVYLFIEAFKIVDDLKYWRLKLSSVLALQTVSLSASWQSRLLKFWLCTPSLQRRR